MAKKKATTVETEAPVVEAPTKLAVQQALGESARVITNLEKLLMFATQPIRAKDLGIVAHLELESGENIKYDIGLRTLMNSLNLAGTNTAMVEFKFTKAVIDGLTDILTAVKDVNKELEEQYTGTNSEQ
jgi:hypothetical protein